MTMSLSLNLVLTATLAAMMWTLSDAHTVETSNRSNGAADVQSTCPQVEQLLQGRDGMPGRDGTPGMAGRDGMPGMAGRDGREGRDGAKGEKGNIGSWGEKGEKGDRGTPGLQGPQGRQGASGPKGAQGPIGPKGESSSGVIYTRWGKSSCPSVQGTELVYSGRVGGNHNGHIGGAANHLCMPNDPQYGPYGSGNQRGNYVYGAEYSIPSGQPMRSVHDHDVPCAVCFATTRGSLLMIPAKISCPAGWTEEYDGYLMSGQWNTEGRTMYICVDKSPDSVPGQNNHDSDRLGLFMVEAKCSGLSCPPYNGEKELTCVVCTQ